MRERGARFAAVLALTLALTAPARAEPRFETSVVPVARETGKPHGASLVELSNGDALATWFASVEETTSDARIYGAVWSRATGQWGAPRVIVDKGYAKSLGNTALFRDDDGVIWMFFAAVRVGGWSGAMVDYIQSRDEGKTWGEGRTLAWRLGHLPRNPPIRVGDHEMLVPLFEDFWYEGGFTGSYTARIRYRDGEILDKSFAWTDDPLAIQPTLARLNDGRILLLARDKSDQVIRRAYSHDGGRTWEPVSMTALPNPGAGICAVYLDDLDLVLLAYNHDRKERNPLSLAVSADGGMTFQRVADLEHDPARPKATFDYPALIRARDGTIHAIWSHDSRATLKSARFNAEWLMERLAR